MGKRSLEFTEWVFKAGQERKALQYLFEYVDNVGNKQKFWSFKWKNRRQWMESMDIRELRDGQKDMQEDITLIREKIFNGFSHAIHENSKEIRSAVEK